MLNVPKALKILCLTLGFNFFANSYSVRAESKLETAKSVGISIVNLVNQEADFFQYHRDKHKDRFKGDLGEFDGLRNKVQQKAEDIISKYSFRLNRQNFDSSEFTNFVNFIKEDAVRFAGKVNYSQFEQVCKQRLERLISALPKEDVKVIEKDINKIKEYIGEFNAKISPDYYEAGTPLFQMKIGRDKKLEDILVKKYGGIFGIDEKFGDEEKKLLEKEIKVHSAAVLDHVQNTSYEVIVDYERFHGLIKIANEYGYDPTFRVGDSDVPISEFCNVLKANGIKYIQINNQIVDDFISDDNNIEKKVNALNQSLGKEIISISTMEDITNGILRYLSPPQTGIKELKAWESEAYLSSQSIDTGFAKYDIQHIWYELAFPKVIGLNPRAYIGKTDFDCRTSPIIGLEANVNLEALNLGLSIYKKINFFTAKLNLGVSSVERGNVEVLFGIYNKYKILEEDLKGRVFPHGNFELAMDFGWFTVLTNILPAITIDKKILPAIQSDYTIRFKAPFSISWKPSLNSYECSTTIKF